MGECRVRSAECGVGGVSCWSFVTCPCHWLGKRGTKKARGRRLFSDGGLPGCPEASGFIRPAGPSDTICVHTYSIRGRFWCQAFFGTSERFFYGVGGRG